MDINLAIKEARKQVSKWIACGKCRTDSKASIRAYAWARAWQRRATRLATEKGTGKDIAWAAKQYHKATKERQ